MPHLAAFLLVAFLIVITPGPDMALVTKNALEGGRREALLTALGVVAGLLAWLAASAAGIVAVLQASAIAFTVVKLCGAAYLLVLGGQALLAARRAAKDGPAAGSPPARRRGPAWLRPPRLLTGPPWRQGLFCNLLNPKIAVLFTSLIPQFVTPGPAAALQAALLAGIFVAMGLVWLVCYALAASAARQFLRRDRVQRAVRAITGTALIGLGLRLAAESR
jgi:threonine/homoserine/homoserine lactone efflux protein